MTDMSFPSGDANVDRAVQGRFAYGAFPMKPLLEQDVMTSLLDERAAA